MRILVRSKIQGPHLICDASGRSPNGVAGVLKVEQCVRAQSEGAFGLRASTRVHARHRR
jgi:hypothetical protein